MSDQTLTCQNCQNQFVFSAGEQTFYQQKGLPQPTLCPICRAMKSQEKILPPKPPKPSH